MGQREIKKRWPQFLAIIAMGAIAVTLFVGLESNAKSLESRVNKAYSDGALPDIWVTTSKHEEADLEEIKKEAGSDSVFDSRYLSSFSVNSRTILGAIEGNKPTLAKPYELVEGSSYEDEREYFIIDEALLGKSGLGSSTFNIGDSVECSFSILGTGAGAFSSYLETYVKEGGSNILSASKVSLSLKISGGMKHPENTSKSSYGTSTALISSLAYRNAWATLLSNNYTDSGVDLVFSSFFKDILGWGDGSKTGEVSSFPTSNQYLIKLGESKLKNVQDKIEDYFGSKSTSNLYALQDRKSVSSCVTIQNDIDQAKSFCYVFPFVFFFTALLVILTTLSQMILKDRLSIGTLKALGVKKSGIYAYYSAITLALVGLGTLIGEVLGPIIIPSIMDAKYSLLYVIPSSTYTLPVLAGVLTAVAFLVSSMLVTVLVCFKEVRLKPAESMRPSTPKLPLKKAKSYAKRASSFYLSFKMGLRNIVVDPLKSFMVVAGVAGCAALLCCGFGIDDTVNYGVDHDLNMAVGSDITASFVDGLDEKTIGMALTSVEGVDDYEPYSKGKASLKNPSTSMEIDKSYFIVSGGKESHFKVYDFADDECAISNKISLSLSLYKGDTIYFSFLNKDYSLKIGEVYDAFSYHGILFRDTNKIIFPSGGATYNSAFIDCVKGANIDEVSKTIQDFAFVSGSMTKEKTMEQINDIVSGIKVMTIAVKVFAILLALVVLYNLALLNFSSRTRDIATLKVLGFSQKEISASLLFESLSLTLLGVGIGLLLGRPFLILVMGSNIVELVTYLYTIYPLSYFYSFLLTFVVAFLVDIFLNRRIKTVKMVESLKSVE